MSSVPFQEAVAPWMQACFGPEISADTRERNHRFIEEALELVQAAGMTKRDAHMLVEYVYSRPVGDLPQEVGGVMVTLAAFCLAQNVNMHACGESELRRIWLCIDKIRAKQQAKPRNSPLPQAIWCDPFAGLVESPMDGGYAVLLHPDGTATDMNRAYCMDCGSNLIYLPEEK